METSQGFVSTGNRNMFRTSSRIVFYYVLVTFAISCGLVIWAYADLSTGLVDWTCVYGLSYLGLTSLLFIFFLVKAIIKRYSRKRSLYNCALLILSVGVFYLQAMTWSYILSAVHIQIINKTGVTVKKRDYGDVQVKEIIGERCVMEKV
jgi:hypothetical protein